MLSALPVYRNGYVTIQISNRRSTMTNRAISTPRHTSHMKVEPPRWAIKKSRAVVNICVVSNARYVDQNGQP